MALTARQSQLTPPARLAILHGLVVQPLINRARFETGARGCRGLRSQGQAVGADGSSIQPINPLETPINFTGRQGLAAIAALGTGGLSPSAPAQPAWPTKPIRLIIPVPAGGQTDVMARLLGQKVGEALGQTVIVESMSGANTMIATEAVMRAPADGHTLLMNLTVMVQNPHLMLTKVRYDVFKDFVAVSRICESTAIFCVPAELPARTIPEFVALARKSPVPLTYGSNGQGSTAHFYGEMFARLAGITLSHVPYRGEAPMVPDLVSNRVNAGWLSGISAAQQSMDGKLRILATTGRKRLSALPTVPTFDEQGFKGLDADAWVGIFAPSGTPKAVVDRLAFEVDKAIATPELRERIISFGLEPSGGTAADFAAVVCRSFDEWGHIIKTSDIRLN